MSRLTREGRLNPSHETNSQARTGTGEYSFHFPYFPYSADHEQDWQPYPVDPYSAIVMVCSLHSVTTGSRDRANVSLIIIIIMRDHTYMRTT